MRQCLKAVLVFAMAWSSSLAPTIAGKDDGAEPDRVVVQHILIGFKKSVRGKEIARSKKEARTLAESLLRRAKDGEEFDALVKEYTDDKYPGIMSLTNTDAPMRGDSHTRADVVYGFGDLAFRLEVGEIGLVDYGFSSSPFGWHIIKRLE